MNKCPHCGSFEQFQKVSVLVDSETSAIDTSTKGVGIGLSGGGLGVGVGGAKTKGTQKSVLASKLAPPVKPATELKGFMFVGIIMVIFGLLLLGPNKEYKWGTIVTILGVILIIRAPAFRRYGRDQMQKYENELDAWNRRWFCRRCGNISEEEGA